MRGISPLVTSKLLYFDAMRGISLSSHRIQHDEGNIPSPHVKMFYFDVTRGGYPSHVESILFRRDKREYPLLVASNLFHFDAMRGDIPLVALNPFHFDAMRGISFSLRRIHSISFPPSPRVESQNPPKLGGFCATLLMSRHDGGGFPLSPPFQTRPWGLPSRVLTQWPSL